MIWKPSGFGGVHCSGHLELACAMFALEMGGEVLLYC